MKLQLANGHKITARIKGKKLRPVCGDHVIAAPIPNEPEWLITEIRPRDNELTRVDSRGKKEILAANLDCIVVMAAAVPRPDWFVVDRYLAAAEIMGIECMVVLNKTDLRAESMEFDASLDDYSRIAYRVVSCSAKTGTNLDQLSAELAGKVSLIVGQSGVGKSSVINRIVVDAELRTGPLSDTSGEGRHTTVNSVLLDLPGGGAVIDSPGVREYAPTVAVMKDINRGFREILELSRQCRFADCKHLREPDCAVKSAVDDESISARRYESYKRLMSTSSQFADRFK